MGVLTDIFFSASSVTNTKTPAGLPAEQHQEQERLRVATNFPPAFQTPYPTSVKECECLEELKRLIIEDEYVRDSGVDQDDEFLLAFVRGKNCDSQKAFKVLHSYVHTRKVKYNKFFQGLSPRNFQYLFDDAPRFCGVLQHTDREGRVVGLGTTSLFNPRVHNTEDCIQAMVTSGLELLRTDNAPRNGLVLIIDVAGFGLKHAKEFTMSRIYMFIQVFLNSYPVKYKGFHVINSSYIFDTILVLIKQLLPKKLRERIYLHGNNLESLYQHVPKDILPQRYGGFLVDDEAFNLAFEQRLIEKIEYYEKVAKNW